MANRNIIAPLSEDELKDLNRDDATVKHTAKDSVFCDLSIHLKQPKSSCNIE